MNPDDHRRLRFQGRTMVASHLVQLIAGPLSADGAESYATGVLEGTRDFITAYFSGETAYAALQQAADQTASPLLGQADLPRRPGEAS